MKKIIRNYWIVLAFVALLLASLTTYITKTLNTDGITVSKNYETLHCDEGIKIITAKNSSTYERKDILKHKTTLEDDICSLDKNFNTDKADRVTLFAYSHKKLEFWTVNRPDIAQYFYKKIIEANPNDALSLYIREEKINENNNP